MSRPFSPTDAAVEGFRIVRRRPDVLVIWTGLVVLTAIPATRIIASLVDALRRHDTLLAIATTVVLSVLALLLIALRLWT